MVILNNNHKNSAKSSDVLVLSNTVMPSCVTKRSSEITLQSFVLQLLVIVFSKTSLIVFVYELSSGFVRIKCKNRLLLYNVGLNGRFFSASLNLPA